MSKEVPDPVLTKGLKFSGRIRHSHGGAAPHPIRRTDIEEKVLEKLATSDKTTIVIERQLDGKMR